MISTSPSAWRVAGLAFVIVFPVLAAFRQNRDWNSASRLLLSYSIAERGTVAITDYVSRDGKLLHDPPTRDLSSPRPGEFYCDKAPGHSFLGAGVVWLCSSVVPTTPYPLAAPVKKYWPTDRRAIVGVNAVLTALTAACVVFLAIGAGAGPWASLFAALAYALASNALPYGTVFYGHVTAGFFATFSLMMLNRSRRSEDGVAWRAALSGLAAGAAVVTEYPLAVLPVVLALTLSFETLCNASERRRTLLRLAAFLMGGLPMAILLGWYHIRVTGSAFTPPYKFEVEEVFAYHRQGAGIPIAVPNLSVALQLLFGSKRGMLYFAPVALLGIAAAFAAMHDRRRKFFAIESLGLFFGLLAINAGFPTWDGGWSSGPRFLLPAFAPLCTCTAWWPLEMRNIRASFLRRIVGVALILAFGFGLFTAVGCTVRGVAIRPDIE